MDHYLPIHPRHHLSLDVGLLLASQPMLITSKNEQYNPRQPRQEHCTRRGPCKRQELISPSRIQSHLISIIIDQLGRLHHKRRQDRTSNSQAQERQKAEQDVEERENAAGPENAGYGGQDEDAGKGDAEDVEDECCLEQGVD